MKVEGKAGMLINVCLSKIWTEYKEKLHENDVIKASCGHSEIIYTRSFYFIFQWLIQNKRLHYSWKLHLIYYDFLSHWGFLYFFVHTFLRCDTLLHWKKKLKILACPIHSNKK